MLQHVLESRLKTKPFSGKSNHRKLWRMAEVMAAEARACGIPNIPDWAGLGWIVSPFYNAYASRVALVMGKAWMERASLIVRGLSR